MDETANQTELASMLGGSGAPGNEAPSAADAGEAGAGTPAAARAAAWTSRLTKELRENGETFPKIAGFKTVSELAEAYLKGADQGIDLSDFNAVMEKLGAPKENEPYGFEKELEAELAGFDRYAKGARLTKEQAGKMLEGYRAMVQNQISRYAREAAAQAPDISKALTDEFGADAAAWYRKAVSGNRLNTRLVKSGLGADKDLARALVLLGREMSEDFTPMGRSPAKGRPQSVREGAVFSYS